MRGRKQSVSEEPPSSWLYSPEVAAAMTGDIALVSEEDLLFNELQEEQIARQYQELEDADVAA